MLTVGGPVGKEVYSGRAVTLETLRIFWCGLYDI
jgi:hypothetical protein